MANITNILLILGAVGAFIFISACTGGNVWLKADMGSGTSGLWRSCNAVKCMVIDDIMKLMGQSLPGYVKACRAFAIIASLAAAAGLILAILNTVTDKIKGLFASILLFIAAGCMLISLAIFTAKEQKPENLSYGWSYILGWLGTFGAVVAGVIGLKA